jgi:hypothetical protein
LYVHPQDREHLPHPLDWKALSQSLIGRTLTTSGLDGAFPRGLVAGTITEVITPLEGECVLHFEAIPLSIWDGFFDVTILNRHLKASL